MKLILFTVFDTAAGAYLPPYHMPTVAMGVRLFTDCAKNPDHPFSKNPDDYILFQIGHFDDANAGLVDLAVPINHGSALEYKYAPEQVDDEVSDDPPIQPGTEG